MTINVEMSASYLSLDHLVSAMAAAVAQASRNAEELQNPEETLAAAALTWESRLRELAEDRIIKGHDWHTLAAEDWVHLNIERDVFFVDDLNSCRELTEVGFRFEVVESERDKQEMVAAFGESTLNGTLINWHYWVEQMPSLSAGEASRLMAGLDPDLYADLNARPVPRNNIDDACQKVIYLERLATAEGKERDTAPGWLQWAKQRAFDVHGGFELAVKDKCEQDDAAAALRALPAKEADYWHSGHEVSPGRRQVCFKFASSESTRHFTLPSFIEDVSERLERWRDGRYALMEAAQVLAETCDGVDAESMCRQMEAAIHAGELKLRKNGVPLPVSEVPRGRLFHRYVLTKDVNEWLNAMGANYVLAYPYLNPLAVPDGVRYELLMFEKLKAKTEWTGGRMAPADVIPLAEAAKLASKHAGQEVTMNDFLRAGARGEIPIRAVCPRTVTMLPVRPDDALRKIPEGSYPDLPADACKVLSITGKANWRVQEQTEAREEMGGALCRFTRWRLSEGEPDLVTTTNECLVMGWDVHALADAFRNAPGHDEPGAEQSQAESEQAAHSFDILMLATRGQLIEAFGSFTGMDMGWFANLNDAPALRRARKSPGQGGRGHIREPYFCPFEVMQWLVNPQRRKGRRMSEEKGWEMLEKCFPRVYHRYAAADPRE